MTRIEKEFSVEQWEFLALIHALGEPVSLDVAGAVVPLPPGPFMNLQRRAMEMGWLRETAPDMISLHSELSTEILEKLTSTATRDRYAAWLESLEKSGALSDISPSAHSSLLSGAHRRYEAALLEQEHAQKSLENGNFMLARQHLQRAVSALGEDPYSDEETRLFLTAALDLVHLSCRVGVGLPCVPDLLEKAHTAANRVGNRRSQCLIGLYRGRFYYLNARLDDALESLSNALEEVKTLGDADILSQSAEFFGLYFYLQGKYEKALIYFDRAMRDAEANGDRFANYPVPAYLGYCAACLGQFHRAVGVLDATWRRAKQQEERALELHARSVLGGVLLVMGKRREALEQLNEIPAMALKTGVILPYALSNFIMSISDYLNGNIQAAYKRTAETLAHLKDAGMPLFQYPIPLLLEMLNEFDRLDFSPLPGMPIDRELERILSSPNIHLRGVALRIKALKMRNAGESDGDQLALLAESEGYLEQSGDPIETGKTLIETARVHLRRGKESLAKDLALRAWEGLSGQGAVLFPNDLRFLLEGVCAPSSDLRTSGEVLDDLFDTIDRIISVPNTDALMGMIVETVNRFFSAERGALFWFKRGKTPELRAACNLSRDEVFSDGFKTNLTRVFECHRHNRAVVIRPDTGENNVLNPHTRALMCIPLERDGTPSGVLYLDSTYQDHGFRILDPSLLQKLARHVSGSIDRIEELGRRLAERDWSLSGVLSPAKEGLHEGFLTRDASVKRLLTMADRVSRSTSTILITGETGVGKELVAKRIHKNSTRADGPFIVMDLSTTPENLVESEMFGYEKGAFTGADKRKSGRIELAHHGTLFIDELGEIPKSVQVKLLRTLQEKTFSRIGGTRTLSSDFRLIAATNRDLSAEVSAGRFRQDLYYRLSVVPLQLPPLRDRGRDVGFLAQKFLDHYRKKLHQPEIKLSKADLKRLAAYHWPGNVRELKNVMERAALLSDTHGVELTLPGNGAECGPDIIADLPTLDEFQRRYIQHVLEKTGRRIGGAGGAAEILGIKRTSLYARMKKLGMA